MPLLTLPRSLIRVAVTVAVCTACLGCSSAPYVTYDGRWSGRIETVEWAAAPGHSPPRVYIARLVVEEAPSGRLVHPNGAYDAATGERIGEESAEPFPPGTRLGLVFDDTEHAVLTRDLPPDWQSKPVVLTGSLRSGRVRDDPDDDGLPPGRPADWPARPQSIDGTVWVREFHGAGQGENGPK